MSTSSSRRSEAEAAIRAHLRAGVPGGWEPVLSEFTEIPRATWWRMVKRARQADSDALKVGEARLALAEHVAASAESQARAAPAMAAAAVEAPSEVVGLRQLNLLGRLEQTFQDIEALRRFSLNENGSVRAPAFLAQSVALKDKTLNTALRIMELAISVQRDWDFYDALVAEVATESPEAAQRIIDRLKALLAIGAGVALGRA